MIKIFVLLWALVLLPLPAWATTYYIAPNNVSPAGSDANNGTAATTPKLTWSAALALLGQGDTLQLANGTYNASTGTGFPTINCATTHPNGTAMNPITVTAENERMPVLKQDGSGNALKITSCAYWVFHGLRVESADKFGVTVENSNIYALTSNHLTFTRMLVYDNNRVNNSHLLHFDDTTDSLIEESEFYKFHRHAIIFWDLSTNNTVRRVYCNSRGEADLPGSGPGNDGVTPFRSTYSPTGDLCVTNYAGSANTIENVISEGNQGVMDIQARNANTGHRLLGSISLNDGYGVIFGARGSTTALMPTNASIVDSVVLNAVFWPFFRGNKNTSIANMTVIDSGSGIVFDFESGVPGDGVYDVETENVLVVNNDNYGINTVNQDAYLHNYPNAFGNGVNFSVSGSTGSTTNSSQINPVLGTCRAWVPDDSPMKAAGLGGADIGANILYRYEDGALTETALWNTSTGEFPHGAIITGINDTASTSVYNVHERLNINYNGCAFPSGFSAEPLVPELAIDINNTLSWTGDMTAVDKIRVYFNEIEGLGQSGFTRYFAGPYDTTFFDKDGTGTWNNLDKLTDDISIYNMVAWIQAPSPTLYITICTVDTDIEDVCVNYSNEVAYAVPQEP